MTMTMTTESMMMTLLSLSQPTVNCQHVHTSISIFGINLSRVHLVQSSRNLF